MECRFTLKEHALMIIALNSNTGGKAFLKAIVKWEELLNPTPAEQKRTGARAIPGGLAIVAGSENSVFTREMPLLALQTFSNAANSCTRWPTEFRKEVLALLSKLARYIKEEEAIVAYSKLPKKERNRLEKAKEKVT